MSTAGRLGRSELRVLGAAHTLEQLEALGRAAPPPAECPVDADCAVLFTSGATGPAKGVVYTHRQAAAQLEVVRSAYALTAGDRFVAAFAPFAILGPALGIASAVPDVDVTAPASLPTTWSTAALRRARRIPARPRPLSATTTTAPARHSA